MTFQKTIESKAHRPTPKRATIATIQTALGIVREVREGSELPRAIVVCGSPGPAAKVRRALLEDGGEEAVAQVFALRPLTGDDTARLARAEVVVYAGEIGVELDERCENDLDVVAASGRPVVVLLEGEDIPGPTLIAAARRRGLSPGAVVGAHPAAFPTHKVLAAIAERAGDAGPGLAAKLPPLRTHVVARLTDRVSAQTGAVAAAVWIPGVDMPILTALQLRLVMQIAACYDHPLGINRAAEIGGVVGAGFGLRAIARELLDAIPLAGWAIKGAVAYSGTRAIAKAAEEYFQHGAFADLEHLRDRAEALTAT